MKSYSAIILILIVLAVNIFIRLGSAFLPSVKDSAEKSYWQDESGQTFLLEIDPYHWYRLVKNLVLYGSTGDKPQYDSFMLAPIGMKIDSSSQPSLHKNLHVYLSYYIFKFVRLFNKNISLMHLVFYLPVLISSLALIVVFLFCFSISRNSFNVSGFFAAMTLGLAPVFLMRSLAGWFDTDPYVILFSVLSVWMLFLSLRQKLSFNKIILFSTISGLCIGLFSLTWDGWWYIFDLLTFSMLFYILNLFLIKSNANKQINLNSSLVSLFLFILSSFLFVSIFSGIETFKHFLSGPLNIAFAKGALQRGFWPNGFLTVNELKSESIAEVIYEIGGITVILFAVLYLILTFFNKKSTNHLEKKFIGFLFFFWITIMVFVSMQANRFSLLLTIPLSISFGLFLEYLFYLLFNKINLLHEKEWVLLGVFTAVFMPGIFINSFPYRNAAPIMNRDWWNVLSDIKTRTPKDAIINSWWGFGHWFKAIADRRVIFDGATQDTPLAYWMARAFLTDSETEALGILRMLNSGSDKAYEELEKLGFNKYKSLNILNKIILLNKKEVDAWLVKYIPGQDERNRILKLTHNPQTAYLVVDPYIKDKIREISFVAGWGKVFDVQRTNCMFKRLYYLNGQGLKNFKPFITKELKNNKGRIIVYKVEWNRDE